MNKIEEERTEKLPEILETVVVGPEDKLVIVAPADTNVAELDEIRESVEERGLEGRVLVLAGVEQLAVLRGAS